MAVEITAFFIGGQNMTVPVSDRLSQLYVGNGTNTRFDFTFRIFQQEDATGIAVRKKGTTDFETIDPATYTVNINPNDMGGFITFNTPPTVGTYFYIAGASPLDQLLDITNYDNFYPDAIERALDKLTALLQEWGTQLDLEKQARILADIHYDSLAMEREENLENRLISYINAVVGITNPAIFDGISDRMIITKDGRTQREFNESIPFWTDDYVNFKQETVLREEQILDHVNEQDQQISAQLNSAIDTEEQRAIAVETSLQNQLNNIGSGRYGFNTYAEFDAKKGTIPANSVVNIAEVNNSGTGQWGQGDNIWDGTTLKKSPYDPILQAQTYTDNLYNTSIVDNLLLPARIKNTGIATRVNKAIRAVFLKGDHNLKIIAVAAMSTVSGVFTLVLARPDSVDEVMSASTNTKFVARFTGAVTFSGVQTLPLESYGNTAAEISGSIVIDFGQLLTTDLLQANYTAKDRLLDARAIKDLNGQYSDIKLIKNDVGALDVQVDDLSLVIGTDVAKNKLLNAAIQEIGFFKALPATGYLIAAGLYYGPTGVINLHIYYSTDKTSKGTLWAQGQGIVGPDNKANIRFEEGYAIVDLNFGGVSKSMLKQSRLNFDKIEKCE